MSQPQFAELLKGIAGQEDGQVHLLLADGKEMAGAEQVKHLMESIGEHANNMAGLKELIGSAGASGAGLQVVTLLLQLGGKNGPVASPLDQARTLRDAIDREWPW